MAKIHKNAEKFKIRWNGTVEGGEKSIVPSEGIVFKYDGKTYKFTGAFAPVNQITGLISF